jgi:hypothetical protein
MPIRERLSIYGKYRFMVDVAGIGLSGLREVEGLKIAIEPQRHGEGSGTAIGSYVAPNSTDWYMAQVKTSLRTDTQLVKVRIVGDYYGSNGFKAWIDQASLSVYYNNSKNDPTYGDVKLVANIFHSAAMPIPEFDGFVSIGLSQQMLKGSIASTELQVRQSFCLTMEVLQPSRDA